MGRVPTVTGVDSRLMRIALSKWIQRGEPKAVQAAIELWRLSEISVKGLQQQLLNRIMVIALEDVGVGPGSLCLASLVLETMQKEKTPKSAAELAVLVQRLTNSPKNQLCPLLYNYYVNKNLAKGTFRFTESAAIASFELEPRDWIAEAKLARALDLFSASLEAKCGEAVYYADQFFKLTVTGGVGLIMRGTGKPEQKTPLNLFWDRMERIGRLRSGALDLYRRTFWFRKDKKDAYVFWLAPLIGVLLNYTEFHYEPEPLTGVEQMLESAEFKQLFINPKPLVFEPYVHRRSIEIVQEQFPELPAGMPSIEQLKEAYLGDVESQPKRRKIN